MTFYLREELDSIWSDNEIFQALENIQGEIYRHKEGRKTLKFQLQGKSYFLKLHQGIGWKEIFKNLTQFRLPVVGASNEWRAIQACHACGIDTQVIAGYGKIGWNPATQHSFLITDELREVQSLEDFCQQYEGGLEYSLKKSLVMRVADISRQLHGAGINHRDFYLCHFLLGGNPGENPQAIHSAPIYIIDLHRAQIRQCVPRRWLVKDLGALYYSAFNLGFGRRDILRFLRRYMKGSATGNLSRNKSFWLAVRRRAVAIHKRDFGETPRLPL